MWAEPKVLKNGKWNLTILAYKFSIMSTLSQSLLNLHNNSFFNPMNYLPNSQKHLLSMHKDIKIGNNFLEF